MMSAQDRLLRLIALFKLLKAAALIVTGIGVLRLMHADIARDVEHWVARLGFDPGSRFVNDLIRRATNISPRRFRELGIGSFVYAALFLTEGIGLWLLKRWAEWFTVIITASLVPFEVYEIYLRPTAIKVFVLIINLVVVAYLLYRITHDARHSERRKVVR